MTSRIMVVDDNADLLRVMDIILTRAGFLVFQAQNSYDALDILSNNAPDLCILDVMKPGTSGFELCKMIRKDATNAYLPVLFLSGRGDEESIAQGMAAGANGYLKKPIHPKTVVQAVTDLLEQRIEHATEA